jgi:type I restriction enzyme S subunit
MEKQLPKNWTSSELSNLISHVIGGDWGKEIDFTDDDYVEALCIRGSEIKNWTRDKGSTAVVRKIKKSSLESRKLELGDILLEISGGGPEQPVGRTVIIDYEALDFEPNISKVCTNFLRLLRLYTEIDSKYINHYLQFFYNSGEITKYQGGSNNLRNLKFKEYETIKIPLPPLPEQNRIVTKLDSLFAQLETIKSSMANVPLLLKDFRQQVLTQAVTGKLTVEWRKGKELDNDFRNRIINNNKRKSNISIPNGWLDLSFDSVVNIKSNLVNPNDYLDYPLITPDVIQSETGILLSKPIVSDIMPISAKHLFTDGDIIYSKIRPYLSKLIIADFDGLCSADMYPISTDLEIKYLFYFMLSNEFLVFATTAGERSVLPKINQKGLNIIPIPTPSLQEQKEIVSRVESLFAKADAIEKQYEALKAKIDKLPQAILHKAFKGELTEQLDSDGDARELLKEIEALKTKTGKAVKGKRVKKYKVNDEVVGMLIDDNESYKK